MHSSLPTRTKIMVMSCVQAKGECDSLTTKKSFPSCSIIIEHVFSYEMQDVIAAFAKKERKLSGAIVNGIVFFCGTSYNFHKNQYL